ncbi:MAG: hypothetical protein MUE92_11030, partial [Chloroflexi bacterium]|nr:hypothetical protein [Chloroflexota bacterium]
MSRGSREAEPGRGGPRTVHVLREAVHAELGDWDARTVDVPGGDVQQSLAWAAHRERTGWEAHRLVLDDGSPALVLGRRWRMLGGGRAYVPKGPAAGGAAPEVVAARLAGIAAWARAAGFDALAADPEIPAGSGFPALLAGAGFRQIEEIGPSRHRVGVPILPGTPEASLLEGITQKTRQQLLAAERRGVRVVRYDARAGVDPGPGLEAPEPARLVDAAEEAFTHFHALLAATGERRGFRVGSRPIALAWWRAALEAGHLLLLEARGTEDEIVAAAVFYRHGRRLTYSHSGDVAALRSTYPGATGLVLWRALAGRADVRAAPLQAVVRGPVDRAVGGPRARPAPRAPRARVRHAALGTGRPVDPGLPAPSRRRHAMSPSERDGGARFGEDAVEDGGAAALRAVLLAAEPAGPRPL